jgi:hypothetical protein
VDAMLRDYPFQRFHGVAALTPLDRDLLAGSLGDALDAVDPDESLLDRAVALGLLPGPALPPSASMVLQ